MVKRRGRPVPTDRPEGVCKLCKVKPSVPRGKRGIGTYCIACDNLRIKLIYMSKRIAEKGLQAEIRSIEAAEKAVNERKELLKLFLTTNQRERNPQP